VGGGLKVASKGAARAKEGDDDDAPARTDRRYPEDRSAPAHQSIQTNVLSSMLENMCMPERRTGSWSLRCARRHAAAVVVVVKVRRGGLPPGWGRGTCRGRTASVSREKVGGKEPRARCLRQRRVGPMKLRSARCRVCVGRGRRSAEVGRARGSEAAQRTHPKMPRLTQSIMSIARVRMLVCSLQ